MDTQVYRVLLVEDVKIALLFGTRVLTTLGCQVDTAETGTDALRQVEKNHYDLIFMDLGLPDISGLEVTQHIRARVDDKRHLPIVALTAHDTPEDRERCLQVNMQDFIAKPLTQAKALSVLQRYVRPPATFTL